MIFIPPLVPVVGGAEPDDAIVEFTPATTFCAAVTAACCAGVRLDAGGVDVPVVGGGVDAGGVKLAIFAFTIAIALCAAVITACCAGVKTGGVCGRDAVAFAPAACGVFDAICAAVGGLATP